MKYRLVPAVIVLLATLAATTVSAGPSRADCEGKLTDGSAQKQELIQRLVELKHGVISALGSEADPFVAQGAFDPEAAFRLMDVLSYEPKPGSTERRLSVVGQVRDYFFKRSKDAEERRAQLLKLGDAIEIYAKNAFAQPKLSRGLLYRSYVAIDLYISVYYGENPQEQVDRDGEPIDDKNDPQKEKKDEKKDETKDQEKQTKEPKPILQELPEDYDPHTKDTEKDNSGDSPKPFAHVIYRGDTGYFKQRNLNFASRTGSNRLRSAPIPMLKRQLPNRGVNPKKILVNIGEEHLNKPFSLYFPPGLIPIQSNDGAYNVEMTESGTFKVTAKKTSFEIDMVSEIPDLNPQQEEFFKMPVGIEDDEWPETMRGELFPLLKSASPKGAADLVEGYIRNRYLYSVDKKDTLDPIAALKEGAFQCDLAALIMVALLRDYLKIPARAVGGLRAKVGSDGSSVAYTPSEGHAWVEAYINGRWITFDPTPHVKDRATKEKSDPNGAADKQKDFPETFPPIKENPQDEQEDGSEDEVDEKSENEKKDSKDDGDKKKNSEKKSKEKVGRQSKAEEKPITDAEKAAVQDELDRELEIGSVSLKDTPSTSDPLIERAVRMILRDAFSPKFKSEVAFRKISQLKADRHLRGDKMRKLLDSAESAVTHRQENIGDALTSISARLRKEDVAKSRAQVVQIADRLRFFAQLLDPGQKSVKLAQLIQSVEKTIRDFDQYAKVNGDKISVVRKFATELPPHARKIFMEHFKIDDFDKSAGVLSAYSHLVGGKLSQLNLMRLLKPLADFVMDSEPAPSYALIQSHEDSTRSKAPPTYTPLDTLNGAQYAIRGQPEKDLIANLLEGSLYTRTRKRQVPVRRAGGFQDPYRVTIGLYDTSGSMSGDPGDFQAALLATFTDLALSELGRSGEHRHLVELMGFDDKVHTIHRVKSSLEARDVIKNYRQKLGNTSGSTDIQAALKQAFAAILDAQKRAGEPLASANIVLMTDGQSVVDIEEVKKWRNAIDRKTPIKILFVAINDTNPDLIKLTEDIRQIGVEASYYREFTKGDIDKFMREAKKVPVIDRRYDYHSDLRPEQLPNSMIRDLDNAFFLARDYSSDYESQLKINGSKRWLEELRSVPHRYSEKDRSLSPFDLMVQHLREFAIDNPALYEDSRARALVIDDLFRHMKELTGRELRSLNVTEVQRLKHLLIEMM